MTFRPIALLAAVAVMASVASPAAAAVTVYDFAGTIYMPGANGQYRTKSPNDVSMTYMGQAIEGSFKFDPSLLPTESATVTDQYLGTYTVDRFYPALSDFEIFTPLGGSTNGGGNIAAYHPVEASSYGLMMDNMVRLDAFASKYFLSFSTPGDSRPAGSALTGFAGLAGQVWNFGISYYEGDPLRDPPQDLFGTLQIVVRGTPFPDPTTAIPSAVPEPASWALMIGGFGMIGAAMRRRQRTTIRFA